ncbi:MAG: hypothetical protein QOI63_295 [Thermoplasmata archaeon]|nr:hypothetical protein [Thermoplasmata archaeon]
MNRRGMVVLAPSRAKLVSALLAAVLLPTLPLLGHGAPGTPAATDGALAAPAGAAPTPAGGDAAPTPFIGPIHYMETIQMAQAHHALQDAGLPLQAPQAAQADAAAVSGLPYNGGPIQKYPHVYLVFWGFGTTSLDDPSNEAPLLRDFFSKVGGTSWAEIQTQYDDTVRGYITNPAVQFNTLTDVWFDNSLGAYPTIPDFFLASEAIAAKSHFFGTGYDPDAQFIIATPHERNTAQFGVSYCAYHTYTTDSAGRAIPYTNLPYMTDRSATCGANFAGGGPLDGVTIVAGHEYAEVVTDPQLNAWVDSGNQENADKCAWLSSGPGRTQLVTMGGTSFAVQGLWSNVDSGCVISYSASLVAEANGPYSVLTGGTVSILGQASGGTTPYTCAWSGTGAIFGSASSCSTTVRYTSSGNKTITLSVTDSHSPANTATDTATVTVTAPPTLVASANGPYSWTHPGSAFSISGTATGGVGAHTCSWSGASATFGGSGCAPTVTYAAAGTYTLTLTVTDSATPANTDTDTATVTVTAPSGPTCAADSTADDGLGAADVKGIYDITQVCGQDVGTNFVVSIDMAGWASSDPVGAAAVDPVGYRITTDSHAPWLVSRTAGTWSVQDTSTALASAGSATASATGVVITLPHSETGVVTGLFVQATDLRKTVQDRAPNAGYLSI